MTITALASRLETAICEVGPDQAEIACAVMHRAFVEYFARGAESGATRETTETLRSEMIRSTRVALVVQGQAVVGMVKFAVDEPTQTLYFSRLSVAPEARGAGVATRILDWLRERALGEGLAGLSCSVRASEARNRAIYEHLGMVVVARSTHVSLTGAVIDSLRMVDLPLCARSAC
ncbi:MAG: GNAT family N-acetyltransferase [Candidatus Lutibacillus vidarii]